MKAANLKAWLADEIAQAQETASESTRIAHNSYGSGYDTGWRDALERVRLKITGMEEHALAIAPEGRTKLEGAVVALVAEFMGAITGTRPPLERRMFPAEMEPTLKRLCDGLIVAVHETC